MGEGFPEAGMASAGADAGLMNAVAAVEAATKVDDCRKLRREIVFFMAGAIIWDGQQAKL